MDLRFDDRVAIVTGAGNGLGRSHALELARRGAKVVVNDFGGARDGEGGSTGPAEAVVDEIKAAGGEAVANGANVTNFEDVCTMVSDTISRWGRVDILVNNAGILRDKSFAKMELEHFKAVMDVHLMGSVNCTKAVWDIMRDQAYGRIVMTTSSSGLYGNFGQSNYGAAKMGVVGFMNTLVLEGMKYNIRVNCLAPTARTRMTEDIGIPEKFLDMLTPEAVTVGLIPLVHEDSPNRIILAAGAGGYARSVIQETDGIYLEENERTSENVMAQMDTIMSTETVELYEDGGKPSGKFLMKAMKAAGEDPGDNVR